jgi:hypothetical protein
VKLLPELEIQTQISLANSAPFLKVFHSSSGLSSWSFRCSFCLNFSLSFRCSFCLNLSLSFSCSSLLGQLGFFLCLAFPPCLDPQLRSGQVQGATERAPSGRGSKLVKVDSIDIIV